MSDRQDRRRTKNSRSKVRKEARGAGYRSGFEQRVAEQLTTFEYEADRLPYEINETHYYTPDFTLPESGIVLECKGRLTVHDRKKLLLIKEQYPELDLRLVFMYPNNKLSSKSKTRYWEWAEKHGFPWCGPNVPEEWSK